MLCFVIATVWFEVRCWDKMLMSDWGKYTRLSFDNNYVTCTCVLVMLLACMLQSNFIVMPA